MFQQTPIFSDVARYFAYPVAQSGTVNSVSITVANSTQFGYITLKPQNYFIATALKCTTNYDNVGLVIATANSNAILPLAFVPNNFTLKIERQDGNNYSNKPMSQAEICSSGYWAGKSAFPLPCAYGPRSNFTFTFVDTTGLFLLTATSGGTAVPLNIKMFLEGYHVPIDQWARFCNVFPEFAAVFGGEGQAS